MQSRNPCRRGCELGDELQMSGIELMCDYLIIIICMTIIYFHRSKQSIKSAPCSPRTSMANPCAKF